MNVIIKFIELFKLYILFQEIVARIKYLIDIFLGRVSVVNVLFPIVGIVGGFKISGSLLESPESTPIVVTPSPELDLRINP